LLFEISKDFGRGLLFDLCDPALRSVALDTEAIECRLLDDWIN